MKLNGYAPHHLTRTRNNARKTDMSDTTHEIWCLAEGDNIPFPVVSSATTSIGVLKQKIKAETSLPREVLAKHLTLWKVRFF